MKRFLVVCLLVGSAAAQDAESERLKLARVAIEAKLKVGDVLRQKGDLSGALKSYREAIALYDAVAVRKAKEPEDIVEERPVAEGEVSAAVTRKAIEKALLWLVGYQGRDGSWDCDGWMNLDPKPRVSGAGGALYDVGVTSLSLIAFLRTGHGDKNNPHADTVARGLKYLVDQQDRAGCVGARASQHFIYNTILATTALCDAYRITRNDAYKDAAQRAANFLAKARNPYFGWRYGVRSGENDTSVTALAVQALVSAKFAGLKIDPGAFMGAKAWLDKVTDPDFGRVGYNFRGGSVARPQAMVDKFPAEKSEAMTAAGILTRIAIGEDPRSSEIIQKGVALCAGKQPLWDDKGHVDMYYWYVGTRALFEVGGRHWRAWSHSLRKTLVPAQRKDGSWDPAGPWGRDGGRIYSTAICALTLDASMRSPRERVFGAAR